MSPKIFQIVVIAAADLLALGLGVWVILEHKPVIWAVISFSSMVMLDIYLVWLIRKSKGTKTS